MASNGTRNGHVKNWIRKDLRLAIYMRDRFTCLLCQADLSYSQPSEVTLDHYLPRCDNGSNNPSNVFTCCHMCNSTRKAKTVAEYTNSITTDAHVQYQLVQPINRPLAKAILKGEVSPHEQQ